MANFELYNYDTGRVELVPEEMIAQAIVNRTHSPLEGQTLNLVDRNTGKAFSSSGANILKEFERGNVLESEVQRTHRKDAVEFGEGAAPLKAAALGAARGLSFGLSDQALVKLADVDPETIKKLRDFNPGVSASTEIAGAVVPALIPGAQGAAAARAGGALAKAGVAARTAGALPRAAVAAGKGVGGLVRGATAAKAGAGLGRRAFAKLAPSVAETAVEGALFATGQVVSEDALGETELVSSQALRHIGLGALLSGGIGAVLPVGGFLGRTAARAVKSKADDFVSAGGLAGRADDQFRNAVAGKTKSAHRAFDQFPKKEWQQFQKKHKLVDKFDDAGDIANRADGIVDTLRNQLDEFTAKLPESQNVGVNLDSVRKKLVSLTDELGVEGGTGPSLNIIKRSIKEVDRLKKVHKSDVLNFKNAIGTRNRIKDTINFKADGTDLITAKKAVRNAWAEAIDNAADPHIAKLGGSDKWRSLRREIVIAKEAKKLAEASAGAAGRTGVSLTSKAIGGGIAATSAITGTGPIGSLAAGGVSAFGSQAVRSRASSTAFYVLNKASGLSALEKAVVATNKRAIKAAAAVGAAAKPVAAKSAAEVSSRINFGQGRVPKKAQPNLRRETFKRQSAQISELLADPVKLAEVVEASVNPIANSAPKVAAAMSAKALNSLQYLGSVMPRDPVPDRVFGKWEPSDLELAKWERVVATVSDPNWVYDRVIDGTLTTDEARAFKETDYNNWVDLVYRSSLRIEELGDKVPYENRISLGILFDTSLDPTTRPEFVAAIQQGFAPPPATPAPQASGAQSPAGLSKIRPERLQSRSAAVQTSLA